MSEPVADVLTRVAGVNQWIGPLLVELLNTAQGPEQAVRLREVAQHLGSLSAELFARAAEVDGSAAERVERVIIEARDRR